MVNFYVRILFLFVPLDLRIVLFMGVRKWGDRKENHVVCALCAWSCDVCNLCTHQTSTLRTKPCHYHILYLQHPLYLWSINKPLASSILDKWVLRKSEYKKKSASIGSVMSEELKDITFSIKQNYLSAVMQGEIERYRTVHICWMVSYGLQRLEALAIVWNTYMQPGRCLSDKSQTVRSWLKGIFGTWILWNSIKLSLALIYIITWPLSYKTIGRGEFPLDYSSKTCDFYLNYIFSEFISIKTLRTKNIFDEQLIVRSKRTCVNVGGWIWTFFLKHHLIWCFPAQISSN
jgi:hypothetical protein